MTSSDHVNDTHVGRYGSAEADDGIKMAVLVQQACNDTIFIYSPE